MNNKYFRTIKSTNILKTSSFLVLVLAGFLVFTNIAFAITFTNADITGDIGFGEGVAAGDVDGDGDLDLYVANGGFRQNKLWINDGSGSFTDSDISGDEGNSLSTVMGDVDGDGDLDIYVTNYNAQNKLWINDGSGGFTADDIAGDTGLSYGATMGDVDGDGDLDIYVAFTSNIQNKLWINDGSANFTTNNITGDEGNSEDAVMGDLDGDGDLDIYVSNGSSQQNEIWINDGSGNFTSGGISGDTVDSLAAVMGDVDGDGDLDIYAANSGSVQNKLWINDGSANFTADDIAGDTGLSYGATMGDVDGDGDLDIYVLNGNGEQNGLWLNDTVIAVASTGSSWRPVPICTIEASPTTITQGDPVTLSWRVDSNPSYSRMENTRQDFSPATRSAIYSPTETTTYRLSSVNKWGGNVCEVTVTVTEPEVILIPEEPTTPEPEEATPVEETVTTPALTEPVEICTPETLDFPRLLKQGNIGDDVILLQLTLTKLNFSPVLIDGIFGKLTHKAVTLFQKSTNIKVDGIVGEETRGEMEKGLNVCE